MKKYIIALISTFLYADTTSIVVENDALIGKDNHYTNGFYYTWMSENNSNYIDMLPFIDLPQKNVAFSLSHAVFTPKNKDLRAKDLNDLPYAGYLDFNFLAYKSSPNYFHELGINIGIVGDAAQADWFQKRFHDSIGHDKPNGWDNQLSNHFIYGISYKIGYKTDPVDIYDLKLDLTTNLEGDIGNFYSGALVGAALRLSSISLDSFNTAGKFIGTNESLLLNYKEIEKFNYSLSFGLFYNKFNRYYLVDKAIDEGYNKLKSQP